ncbi:SDR family oxidoreductase [Anaeromassilibacillus senegalensis]|uniref:SDR family oxidoreductase n=1 Tax=Anaeromassilibacillus senegalensis TaxID=1673717 RepID=UPI000681D7F9|nr:SDR family oxidoreductase [Anaeromassilibacillus senegalensis]
MKALFIGGTGTISSAVSELAVKQGVELTLLTRSGTGGPKGAEMLKGDIEDVDQIVSLLRGRTFDVVADFVAYTPEQAARDIELFHDKTEQYIYISSASAYQKPVTNYLITESTPLYNPYWQYSRDKIACEDLLMTAYRVSGFPVTIVRPSHTYGDRSVPVAIHGKKGSWQVLARLLEGKPVIVHGDGLSLWTFTHNTDFAKGFTGLMGNPHAIGQAVHITSDESLTWNAAFDAIGKALGVKPNLTHISSDLLAAFRPDLLGTLLGDKAHSVIFDNTKLKRLVPDYCATTRFDQGVKRTVEYVLSHPECQTPDPDFDAWCDKTIAAYSSCILNFC